MDWVKAINEAISYMESNLTEELSLADIADSAKISEYHFQRAFSVITGMTPTEYVRKRRLSQAGIDLSKGNCQVLDVALKYGYDSPESFSKAFSRFHGITPTQAKNREKLKRFNRCTVRIVIEESKDMDYRIENWEAMNLILYTKEYNVEDSEQAIISLWKEYYEDEERRKVHSRIAVCRHSKKSGNRAEYGIGCETSEIDEIPVGFQMIHVPCYTWAIFKCIGPTTVSLKEMWKRIYTEWLPSSEYELISDYYDYYLERLPEGDVNSQDYVCEICIPVKKIDK